jgi:hypothetical protein
VAVHDDRTIAIDPVDGVRRQLLEGDAARTGDVFLLVLLTRKGFEEERILLAEEPLRVVHPDVGRHPAMFPCIGCSDGAPAGPGPWQVLSEQWHTAPVSDDDLLKRAEEALTEIKVNQGLSEAHAAVLAALRIRLTGTADKTLEEMLAASEDRPDDLTAKMAETESAPKPSLDDLLSRPGSKPDWPA